MTTPITPERARKVSRRWPIISGGTAVALAVTLGLLVAFREGPYGFDTEWLDELVEHRNPFWDAPALAMNFLGGGWFGIFVVPIAIAVTLLLIKRRWSALYFVLATIVSAGLVQLLKTLFGRDRPLDMLVSADPGSFPSGHVANAATMAVALAILFQRVWVWAAGGAYVVLMMLSRTYLGVHWLSDTVGGLLLGAAVAILLWAPLATRLQREWSAPAAKAR
ncbi:phosphatase PAP2 family protein [Salinibacterium sp. G-O1]|uniref:phosphatase PAP2 family protein n=1 Tax=Salinibacterium sp. G-O1 TaxID=3046208 RepID=UPI0024BB6BC5|nr:phosphatase PAP2 family protein [Salinibacterium sp. G-O1]MDJ0334350.1 phosphatase PAP2 family protein [Salinibacterium sp. G-O1]